MSPKVMGHLFIKLYLSSKCKKGTFPVVMKNWSIYLRADTICGLRKPYLFPSIDNSKIFANSINRRYDNSLDLNSKLNKVVCLSTICLSSYAIHNVFVWQKSLIKLIEFLSCIRYFRVVCILIRTYSNIWTFRSPKDITRRNCHQNCHCS